MNVSRTSGLKICARVISFKGTTLKCLLDSGEKSSIHGISFNRKLGRNFRKGDEVSVIVTSEIPFQIALAKEYVKPLLIFDMHGVLGEREPFQKGKPRGFIRRPFCEEFIRFCAERFEIAVWSCAMKKNIDLKMFDGVQLIFVWTQDESTNLYPYMSIVSEHKPLFFKELRTVWEKFPSYDATNCILLDNHIEKCEKNPLGTCLIVPDFILDVPDDSVISPEGEIAQHLRAMTEPDPQGPGSELHLSRYISQRAGTSALFPLSYQSTGRRLDPTFTAPVPSTVEAILNQPGSETRSGAVEESLTAAGPVAPTGPKSPMEKRNPLLVKMFREDLRMIASAKDEYLLTTESLAGGTHLLVVVDPGAKQLSLLFSDLSVHKVSLPVDDGERAELEEWMDDLSGGMTVFVVELSDSECHKELVLTVLDVAMLNGTTTSQQDLLDRVARASGWLFSSPLDDLHLAFCGKPGRITCREYTALSQVSAKTLGAMVSSVNSSSIDSLVFIPKSRSWQDHVAYQWQPAQRNTVDVSIGLQELAAAVLEVQRRQGDSVSVRGIYRHEATAAAESLSVSVSIAAIPREVAHLLEAKAAGEDAESCLVVCRLALQGAGGGDDWVAEAVEFHPLSERRVVSAEDIRCVRRALSENICLSDLLRAVD